VLRQSFTVGSGLYRAALSGDAPALQDDRFDAVRVEPAQAGQLLAQGAVDVWIDGAQVHWRPDEKSLNAVGALRRVLEKQEIARIGASYPEELAFPLRVGVVYLDGSDAAPAGANGAPDSGAAGLPESDDEVLIPSLMAPRLPFAEVVLSLVYVLPVTFISIFFTSSFMDEKINRRLTILLSTPVTPLQIILGKMLPYAVFSLAATALIAALTRANLLLAWAIFIPTTLFIFAIYLMVPMFYRTFKDTTFISMLVTTLTTAFLVFPAMFNGVSDLAYMSPLTLAIQMYRGETFGWREYLFPSLPMALIFGLALYAGTKMLNEEFLMGYRPLGEKIKDAIYLVMDRRHPYRSTALLSLLLVPVVYLVQLVVLAISSNLPLNFMLVSVLFAAALIEEVVKSIGIVVWTERGVANGVRQILALSLCSAVGFLAAEKFLLLFSTSIVSQSELSAALFNAGYLLLPLAAHFAFTSLVTLLRSQARLSYPLALVAGTLLHSLYNWLILRGF